MTEGKIIAFVIILGMYLASFYPEYWTGRKDLARCGIVKCVKVIK